VDTGTSVVEITPEVGCDLSGYVARVQPSVGLHSPLYARGLYLEDGQNRLLWLHAELVGLERGFVEDLKTALHAEHGLKTSEVVISATHTHAGPATLYLIHCGAYNADYAAKLKDWLLTTARRAVVHTEPAILEFAEAHNESAIDRRGKPSAHTDHRLPVLAWRRKDGSYAAVWANYPMHNVALGSDNRYISSELYGRAALTISSALPGQPVVLFTNGACGNLNPPHHTTDFAQLEAWGDSLAASALDALKTARPVQDSRLSSASEIIKVPLDIGGPAQIRAWADALERTVAEAEGYVADRVRASATAWRELMIRKHEEGTLPMHWPLEAQVLRIGPVRVVCLGAEVFSRMADELREAAGEPLYVAGYANGAFGYLPTPEAYAEGGYEVDSAFIFYGGFRPAPHAFGLVREHAAAMLRYVE